MESLPHCTLRCQNFPPVQALITSLKKNNQNKSRCHLPAGHPRHHRFVPPDNPSYFPSTFTPLCSASSHRLPPSGWQITCLPGRGDTSLLRGAQTRNTHKKNKGFASSPTAQCLSAGGKQGDVHGRGDFLPLAGRAPKQLNK